MHEEKTQCVVSVLDDAIDTEAMTLDEMSKYLETRDTKLLKYKPGRQPTLYYIREVRQSVWESYVMATESDAERFRRAFLCGVVRVKNLLQRDGSIIEDWTPSGVPVAAAMPDADAERFSAADRAEIGLIVFDRSFLAPRTVRAYRLPPMLPRLLASRAFRHADASQQSPAQSSGEASSARAVPSAASGATAAEPSSTAASSASHTVVTATGAWPAE